MPIDFNEQITIEMEHSTPAGVTQIVPKDLTDVIFAEEHPLYGWRVNAQYDQHLLIQPRLGDGGSSGNTYTLNYEAYNNGMVTGADIINWIRNNNTGAGIPSLNFYAIPLYDPYDDTIINYLVAGIRITSYNLSNNSASIIAYAAPIIADHWDLNRATTFKQLYSSTPAYQGAISATSTGTYFSSECFIVHDEKLRDLGIIPAETDDYAFYCPWRFRTSPYPTPDAISISTDSAGWIPYGQIYVSAVQLRLYNYGVPNLVAGGSPEVGPESEPGGYDPDRPGNRDDSSDTIALPDDPTLGVSSTGFVRVYNIGSNALVGFGVELFPPLAYTAPTAITAQDTTEAVINGFNSLVTFMANIPSFFDQIMANTLINYVIDCHIIPVNPGSGTSERIKVGYKEMISTGGRLYQDYVNVPCGSINIGEYYGAFADFLTSAKLYLPFVGFVPLRPEHFIGDTLKVDYKFNIIDGSFTAYVRSGGKYVNNGNTAGTIIGQYAGNACIHVPITGVTYSSMVSGLVGAGGGMAAGAASGNIGAVATSALAAANARGDIAQSNAYNGSAAFLGCRTPFLLIERPVSSWSRNYQHEIGIPANIYATLSDVSGFVQMTNVHVDGISRATDQEKEEIRKLLASGVIV